MAVNEQEIRSLMEKPAATSIPADTINSNLTRNVLLVNNIKNASATQNMVDEAVKSLTVWMTYGAYTEGIERELGKVPEAQQVKLDHFRKVAELFLAQVSGQPIDLEDPVESAKGNEIPVDPSVTALSTSEAYGSN